MQKSTTTPPMPFDDDEPSYFESLWDEDPLEGDDEPDPGEECLTAAERNPSMLRGR
jgi:hypothetical protein